MNFTDDGKYKGWVNEKRTQCTKRSKQRRMILKVHDIYLEIVWEEEGKVEWCLE